ncbi:MAG: phosphoadenosine phosphosulfate reductase family protein [Anaerorhabdus sp.]|uniref:hypothetical protein n=1 Tax=Anaerorhabdus sp. TaxID=1872524 RepID=UPI002FC9971D
MNEVEYYLEDLKSRFSGIDKTKYYLSYSGGKDSHFLYWFIKEYLHDKEIEIVSVNTFMEHQEIRECMYKNSNVVLLPKMKPFEIKEKYGIPCFSKSQDDFINRYQNGSRSKSTLQRIHGNGEDGNWTRFKINNKAKRLLLSGELHKVSPNCCKYLKKEPFKDYEKSSGRKAIIGVRGGESILRKSKYTSRFTKDKKFTPLHDLTDEMMDKIYAKYNIPIPKVYKYITRTGCMGCPYGSWKKDTQKELELISENQRKFVENYFKESYEVLGIISNDIQLKFDL